VRVAGDKMDEAIMGYIKRKYNMAIGEQTAERIKISIGNAYPLDTPHTMEVKGRDMVAGIPKTVVVGGDEIREALAEPINAIIDLVRRALNETPPQLAADLIDRDTHPVSVTLAGQEFLRTRRGSSTISTPASQRSVGTPPSAWGSAGCCPTRGPRTPLPASRTRPQTRSASSAAMTRSPRSARAGSTSRSSAGRSPTRGTCVSCISSARRGSPPARPATAQNGSIVGAPPIP